MKTTKDAKSKGTILIADYDFGDVNIERTIIEGAGFEILAAQCKSEDHRARTRRRRRPRPICAYWPAPSTPSRAAV